MDRINRDPAYRLAYSEVPNLITFLQFAPERLPELKRRIREGKIELTNGFFLEPDVNLSSGEALVQMGVIGLNWYDKSLRPPPPPLLDDRPHRLPPPDAPNRRRPSACTTSSIAATTPTRNASTGGSPPTAPASAPSTTATMPNSASRPASSPRPTASPKRSSRRCATLLAQCQQRSPLPHHPARPRWLGRLLALSPVNPAYPLRLHPRMEQPLPRHRHPLLHPQRLRPGPRPRTRLRPDQAPHLRRRHRLHLGSLLDEHA